MGQEMIYDYLSGNMDKGRKASFEKFLNENDDFRQEVESVEFAMAYLEDLSQTELTEPVVNYVKERIGFWGWIIKDYKLE